MPRAEGSVDAGCVSLSRVFFCGCKILQRCAYWLCLFDLYGSSYKTRVSC